LADYISKHFDYNIQVVDYKDGVMAKFLNSNNRINFIEFRDGHPTDLIKDTTVIMQSILPNTIRPELNLKADTKILFWTLFHYNLVPDFLPINGFRHLHHNSSLFKLLDFTIKKKYYKKLKNLVTNLHEKESLFFMDYSNYDITSQFLNLDLVKPKIIPICIDEIGKNKDIVKNKDNTTFNICWIGRVEDFKTSILQYSLNQVKQYANNSRKKIQYNIIGYGKDLERVKSNISNSYYFIANFMGKIDVDSVKEFLVKNVDLLMSMGTAALEGGKQGVPTILLDASYSEISIDYKFKWLFDSDGSNVAKFIHSKSFNNNGKSIDKIIESVVENYEALGGKCLMYVDKNHSIKSVSSELLSAVNKAIFTWREIDPILMKKSKVRIIYDNYRYNT